MHVHNHWAGTLAKGLSARMPLITVLGMGTLDACSVNSVTAYINCWKLRPGESSTCGRDTLPRTCDPCPAASIDRALPAVGRGCCE